MGALDRIVQVRRAHPEVVVASTEITTKQNTGILEGDAWPWGKHTQDQLLLPCGNFATLKRMAVLLSKGLDESRAYGEVSGMAYFHQAFKVVEAGIRHENHDLAWA